MIQMNSTFYIINFSEDIKFLKMILFKSYIFYFVELVW